MRKLRGADDVCVQRRVCAARASFFAVHVAARLRAAQSAWALPRPSAIASAKLANSTVNHSQTRDAEDEPAATSPPSDAATATHKHRRQHAADEHGEHHRIADLVPRVELARTNPRCARRTIGGSNSGRALDIVDMV